MTRLLALCVVAACAHTPDLALRPDPTPPTGSTTFEFTAGDGAKLLARQWAAAGDAKAVIVIMHGLKDHSARYADLATRLVASGHTVYAFDLRGHGRSTGPRAAPQYWNDYVDDLDRFLAMIETREPGRRIYVFGHSMGGAIATRTAQLHEPRIAGLMLSAPALAIDAPPLMIALIRVAGLATPRAPGLKLANEDFSSTPGASAAMEKDELVSQPPGPVRTAAGLVDGMRAIWADIDRVTMPILALHGTNDRLTAPYGSRALIRTAPATDKTLHIYDGLFHDLLHEPGRARVETDIVAWVDAQVAGTPATPPPIYDNALNGDPVGWTQAVELAGGVSRTLDDDSTRFAGTFALALALPRPIGWHGGVTARRVNEHYSISVRPLGVAARLGATLLGLSGGVALLTDTEVGVTGGLWFEQPLGPVHLGARAELERSFASSPPLVTWYVGTLRLGSDRTYWPHARAGVGPAISGGYQCVDDLCGWVALLGFQLYGVD